MAYLLTRAGISSYSAVRRGGSGPEHGALDGQARRCAGVEALHDRARRTPRTPARSSKHARAAQAQRLVERRLQRVVARLDRAVLVRLTRVAAARAHAVVAAQVVVAARQLSCSARLLNAADRLSVRCSSGTPPRRHSAACSPVDSAMKLSPPTITSAWRQPECASANWYSRCGNATPAIYDPELVADGEVRQPEPARRVFLREEDLALGAMHGAPLAHAPLQRAQHAGAVLARDGGAAVPPAA